MCVCLCVCLCVYECVVCFFMSGVYLVCCLRVRACVCFCCSSLPTYAWSNIFLYAQNLVLVFLYMSVHAFGMCGGDGGMRGLAICVATKVYLV